ncbi:MAG: hypothetical protein ABSG31_11105, partial [Tepidisphaeraceae bacterium]
VHLHGYLLVLNRPIGILTSDRETAFHVIRISAAAAKTTGWPVEVRCGIFESEEEFPVFGGGC